MSNVAPDSRVVQIECQASIPEMEMVMMQSFKRLVKAAAGLMFTIVMLGAQGRGSTGSVIFQPAKSYDRGQPMTFTATAGEKPEWITFFFRSSATAEFVARLMEADQAGRYSTTLSGDDLTADHLEYYLAYKTQAQIRYLPEDVPAHFFSTPASAKPMPELAAAPEVAAAGQRASSFSLAFEGSASQLLSEKKGASAGPDFQQSENLRLAFQTGHEHLQVLFDARLQYNSLPPGSQKELNFAEGRMQVSLGQHSLQAGKISPPGTELGLQSFARNGLAYGFNGTAWQLNLFSLRFRNVVGQDMAKTGGFETNLNLLIRFCCKTPFYCQKTNCLKSVATWLIREQKGPKGVGS